MASRHPAKMYPGNGIVGSSPTSSARCPRRSMDRTQDCGSCNAGSIPAESTRKEIVLK